MAAAGNSNSGASCFLGWSLSSWGRGGAKGEVLRWRGTWWRCFLCLEISKSFRNWIINLNDCLHKLMTKEEFELEEQEQQSEFISSSSWGDGDDSSSSDMGGRGEMDVVRDIF